MTPLRGLIQVAWDKLRVEKLSDNPQHEIEQAKTAFYCGAMAMISTLASAEVLIPSSILEMLEDEMRARREERRAQLGKTR